MIQRAGLISCKADNAYADMALLRLKNTLDLAPIVIQMLVNELEGMLKSTPHKDLTNGCIIGVVAQY